MSTLDEYRNQTGDFAPETGNTGDEPTNLDAADSQQEEVEQEVEEQQDTHLETLTSPVQPSDDEDEPQLSEKEKTAFQKALEREKRKMEEEKERIRQEAESKSNPYKEIVDLLGGDPDKIKATIQQNKIASDAQQLANAYGWDEYQTQAYIQQEQAKVREQQTQRELQELRIVNEINKLSRMTEYSGIDTMEKEIVDKVIRSNGALSAKEAFFALGGEAFLKQRTRETEQRMVAQRAQKRTVQSDSSATPSGEKPIPQNILEEGLRMGMNEKEIRDLMNFDATNIKEYRQKKAK